MLISDTPDNPVSQVPAVRSHWQQLDATARLAYLEAGQPITYELLMESLNSPAPALRAKCRELLNSHLSETFRLLGLDFQEMLRVWEQAGVASEILDWLQVPASPPNTAPAPELLAPPVPITHETQWPTAPPTPPFDKTALYAALAASLPMLAGPPPTQTPQTTPAAPVPPELPTPAPPVPEKPHPAPAGRRGPRQVTAPLARDGHLRFPSDYLNKAVIEALATKAMRDLGKDYLVERGIYAKAFWRAYPFAESHKNRGAVSGVVGFTEEPAQAIWEAVQRNGALAVKVQFALWSLAYAETNAEAGKFISVSLSDLCDKLGYKRKKGAHKRENKENVLDMLDYLTSIHLAISYTTPKGQSVQLDGPLWLRGTVERVAKTMPGVPPKPGSWEPTIFRYAPGDFFNNSTWRAYNKDVALVGEGLLQLSASSEDKWAVMVCGYLVTLSRMNGYRPARVRAETLLLKTGLWECNRQEPGRMFEMLHRALDRACQVKVLKSWTPLDSLDPEVNYDDLDAAETRLVLAEKDDYVNHRLRECYLIEWPDALMPHAERLERAHHKHLTARKVPSRKREKEAK